MNKKIALFLIVVGIIVFSNSFNGDFVYDDNIVLTHSLFNQPQKMLSFLLEPYFEDFKAAGLYRPLTQISFAINFMISSSPFIFHFTNVLLHIINSILVYYLINKLSNNSKLSFISSIIFLVLPVHVEAVASIVGRAELLSFLFGILSMLYWLNSRYVLSALMVFLSIMSKETAIVIPAIIFIISLWQRRKDVWILHHFFAIASYLAFRIYVLGSYSFGPKVEFVFNPLAHVSIGERLSTALKVFMIYLQTIFAPYRLSIDYSYNQIPIVKNLFTSLPSIVGLLILVAMSWLLWESVKKRVMTIPALSILLFLLPYLLISNLIIVIGTIMGERLMYLPSLGIVILIAFVLNRLFQTNQKVLMLFLGIIVIICGLVTFNQNKVWANADNLFESMYQRSPNSVVAKTYYGIHILNENPSLAGQLSRSAYNDYPDYVQNLNLLAAISAREGKLSEAEKLLVRALELRPSHQNSLQNLSRVYFSQKKYMEAERITLELVSKYGGVGNVILYAIISIEQGQYQTAINTLDRYLSKDPSNDAAKVVKEYALSRLNHRIISQDIESNYRVLYNSFSVSQ